MLQLATKDRAQLVLENIALRHQLAVYKRSIKRPNINDGDRVFWITVMRMLKVTCPPNPDPPRTLGSRTEEDRNGTEATHERADHPEAA